MPASDYLLLLVLGGAFALVVFQMIKSRQRRRRDSDYVGDGAGPFWSFWPSDSGRSDCDGAGSSGSSGDGGGDSGGSGGGD